MLIGQKKCPFAYLNPEHSYTEVLKFDFLLSSISSCIRFYAPGWKSEKGRGGDFDSTGSGKALQM